MKDTERINWLQKQEGSALISDDFGHWAVVSDGFQNVVMRKKPIDTCTSFFIEKGKWSKTIREAIDKAMKGE